MFPITYGKNIDSPQKILILTAIPEGLRPGKEIREIEESIRRAVRRDLYTVHIRTAVRPKDFRRVLAEEKPSIVHFCGHGLENGCLQMENDVGCPQSVTPESLASLFKLHSEYVYCVLLNACYSEKAAISVSHHISYAIGMNQSIKNDAAVIFSQGFYDALGYGSIDKFQLIERAFLEGKVAIQLEGLAGHEAPVLQRRFNNSVSIFEPPEVEPLTITCRGLTRKPPVQKRVSTIRLYTALRQSLERGDWKAADMETSRIILAIAKRETEGWLRSIDIEREIPCVDLKIIDNLWHNFSDGRFGLSAQKDIWLSQISSSDDFNGSLFKAFGNQVGWRTGEDWLSYDNLDFSPEAPDGHFPIMRCSHDDNQSDWLGVWRDNFKEFICLSRKCL